MATKEELDKKIAVNAEKYRDLSTNFSDLESQSRAASRKAREYQEYANGAATPEGKEAYLEEVARYKEEAATLKSQSALVFKEMNDISADQNSLESQINTLSTSENAAAQNADPASTIKTAEATNESQTEAATAEKYEDTTNVPATDTAPNPNGDPNPNAVITPGENQTDPRGPVANVDITDKSSSRLPANIAKGAVTKNSAPVSAAWAGAKDLRVFLRVPNSYLVGPSKDEIGYPLLKDLGGIMFPYTPQITYESAAAYTAVNPVHSNYTQQFYKNSSVGNISISGKFTVQNQKEGAIYCAIINLLRSLTKMRWGEYDANAGAPPPVCRLDAFGDYMLSNVPVVVTSVKFEMPDTVDYIQVPMYKTTLVPTISTITLGLAIMYSRRETQDFNVNDFMTGKLKGQGYL